MKFNKLTLTALITILSQINGVTELFKKVLMRLELIEPIKTQEQMDTILNLIGIIGVFIAVFYLLTKYDKTMNHLRASNIVNSLRNRHHFMQSFNDVEFYRLPNETDEDVFRRLPQSQYRDYIKQEYQMAKTALINMYDLKPSEAIEYLDELYGITNKKK